MFGSVLPIPMWLRGRSLTREIIQWQVHAFYLLHVVVHTLCQIAIGYYYVTEARLSANRLQRPLPRTSILQYTFRVYRSQVLSHNALYPCP